MKKRKTATYKQLTAGLAATFALGAVAHSQSADVSLTYNLESAPIYTGAFPIKVGGITYTIQVRTLKTQESALGFNSESTARKKLGCVFSLQGTSGGCSVEVLRIWKFGNEQERK